jgi:hypothetical protein
MDTCQVTASEPGSVDRGAGTVAVAAIASVLLKVKGSSYEGPDTGVTDR